MKGTKEARNVGARTSDGRDHVGEGSSHKIDGLHSALVIHQISFAERRVVGRQQGLANVRLVVSRKDHLKNLRPSGASARSRQPGLMRQTLHLENATITVELRLLKLNFGLSVASTHIGLELGSPSHGSLVRTGQVRNLSLRSLHVTIQGCVVGEELRMPSPDASDLVAVRQSSRPTGTYRPRSRIRSCGKAGITRLRVKRPPEAGTSSGGGGVRAGQERIENVWRSPGRSSGGSRRRKAVGAGHRLYGTNG